MQAAEQTSTPPLAPEEKPKRKLFSLGRKPKAAVEETPAATADSAGATETHATADDSQPAPAQKRGWWPFGKKDKASPVIPVSNEATEVRGSKTAPSIAATPPGSPTPESFEFSEAELLEITAEIAPPASPKKHDPQALAADEVLDFELDLPLENSGSSIEPVLSDAPPPATGADDDDFLDFLAEELPGAKQKRVGG